MRPPSNSELRYFANTPLRGSVVFLCALLAPNIHAAEEKDPEIERRLSTLVRESYPQLHACYQRVAAKDRSKEGTIFVKVAAASDGSVASAKVEHAEIKGKGLNKCLLSIVRDWQLGESIVSRVGGAPVVVPLTFRANRDQYAVNAADLEPEKAGKGIQRWTLATSRNVGAVGLRLFRWKTKRWRSKVGAQHETVLYVLSGLGTLSSKRKRWTVRSGMAIWLPLGVAAKIRGRGFVSMLEAHIARMPSTAPLAAKQAQVKTAPGASLAPVVVDRRKVKALSLEQGKLRVVPLLGQAKLSHRRFYVGVIEASDGAQFSEHEHRAASELLYVIKGRGRMSVRGLAHVVRPQDTLFIAKGRNHSLKVERPVVALQLYVPGGPEQRFLDLADGNLTAGRSAR